MKGFWSINNFCGRMALVVIILMVSGLAAIAQPPPPPPPPPNGAPIDGFFGILVMAAGALLGKRFMDNKRSA